MFEPHELFGLVLDYRVGSGLLLQMHKQYMHWRLATTWAASRRPGNELSTAG